MLIKLRAIKKSRLAYPSFLTYRLERVRRELEDMKKETENLIKVRNEEEVDISKTNENISVGNKRRYHYNYLKDRQKAWML